MLFRPYLLKNDNSAEFYSLNHKKLRQFNSLLKQILPNCLYNVTDFENLFNSS